MPDQDKETPGGDRKTAGDTRSYPSQPRNGASPPSAPKADEHDTERTYTPNPDPS